MRRQHCPAGGSLPSTFKLQVRHKRTSTQLVHERVASAQYIQERLPSLTWMDTLRIWLVPKQDPSKSEEYARVTKAIEKAVSRTSKVLLTRNNRDLVQVLQSRPHAVPRSHRRFVGGIVEPDRPSGFVLYSALRLLADRDQTDTLPRALFENTLKNLASRRLQRRTRIAVIAEGKHILDQADFIFRQMRLAGHQVNMSDYLHVMDQLCRIGDGTHALELWHRIKTYGLLSSATPSQQEHAFVCMMLCLVRYAAIDKPGAKGDREAPHTYAKMVAVLARNVLTDMTQTDVTSSTGLSLLLRILVTGTNDKAVDMLLKEVFNFDAKNPSPVRDVSPREHKAGIAKMNKHILNTIMVNATQHHDLSLAVATYEMCAVYQRAPGKHGYNLDMVNTSVMSRLIDLAIRKNCPLVATHYFRETLRMSEQAMARFEHDLERVVRHKSKSAFVYRRPIVMVNAHMLQMTGDLSTIKADRHAFRKQLFQHGKRLQQHVVNLARFRDSIIQVFGSKQPASVLDRLQDHLKLVTERRDRFDRLCTRLARIAQNKQLRHSRSIEAKQEATFAQELSDAGSEAATPHLASEAVTRPASGSPSTSSASHSAMSSPSSSSPVIETMSPLAVA